MSNDINDNVLKIIKINKLFLLQIDDSTNRSSKAQLLGFRRSVNKTNIVEQFIFCKDLKPTTEKDIFDAVNFFFEKFNLLWNYCCAMCTDTTISSMTRKYKNFIFFVKIKNPVIITTHCFIQQEALVTKIIKDKNLKVLNVIKIINYIISPPLKIGIFEIICKEWVYLPLHTEVRLLSCGQVLNRVIKFKEEL